MIENINIDKCGIIGDLHLGISHGDDYYHEYITASVEKALIEMKEAGKDYCIQLGDFFDNRRHIPVKIVNYVIEDLPRLLESLDMTMIVILGNHDIYGKHSSNIYSAKILSDKRYIVVSKPTNIGDVVLIPWVNKSNYKDAISLLNGCSKDSYVFGHFELSGFKMYASSPISDKQPFDLSVLKRFKKVVSGHFHHPSSSGNISYAGSFLSLDRNDIADLDKKGWYEIKENRLILHKIHTTIFKTVNIVNAFDYVDLNDYAGKNVDVVIDKDFSDQHFIDKFLLDLSNSRTLSIKVVDERLISKESDVELSEQCVKSVDLALNELCDRLSVRGDVQKYINNVYFLCMTELECEES